MRPRTKEETAAYLAGYEAGRSVKRAPQWRPIDELPHDMGAVLAINSNGCQAVINMLSATGIGHFIDDDGAHERLSCITHWAPLPEPPK